jgi:uncharacterized membrane protein
MIFPPLLFFLMVAFFILALILFPLLWLQAIGTAFNKLGLDPYFMVWLIIFTLLGSLVNIPLYSVKTEEQMGETVVSYYGMGFQVPQAYHPERTVVAVNVGGALIPVGLSIFLMTRMPSSLGLPLLLGLVIMVVYRLARPIKGLGIGVPGLVPPLVAAFGAYLLFYHAPGMRAPSAYIATTLGVLIGGDLLNLKEIPRLGAPVASIGGAGTFDAIFLGGIIAVLLS